jgi:hypothetical protein
MANFAGTCVSRHGLANGARPSRRRKKSLLCERANPAGFTAVPMLLYPEPWKSRPSGLRFGAVEKGALAPVLGIHESWYRFKRNAARHRSEFLRGGV